MPMPMSCRERLLTLFDGERVPHRFHRHRAAYTAQHEAGAEHLPGKRVAKVVVAYMGAKPLMLVVPADRHADLDYLAGFLGFQSVRLATELEFESLFPDCEVGAMPALGNLYGLPVYLDVELANEPEVMFPAGTHTESVTIPTRALERLTHAILLPLATKPARARRAA